MLDTKAKIARNLDTQFAKMGFAQPGVDALRDGAEVSLRTLYKYYPSREAMVAGALEYRNRIYLDWIAGGPGSGHAHVLHIYDRLNDWLVAGANTGCLFLNALAAYPDAGDVRAMANHHKDCVRQAFADRLHTIAPDIDIPILSESLLTIHEGQTDMSILRGPKVAHDTALMLARALLNSVGIPDDPNP